MTEQTQNRVNFLRRRISHQDVRGAEGAGRKAVLRGVQPGGEGGKVMVAETWGKGPGIGGPGLHVEWPLGPGIARGLCLASPPSALQPGDPGGCCHLLPPLPSLFTDPSSSLSVLVSVWDGVIVPVSVWDGRIILTIFLVNILTFCFFRVRTFMYRVFNQFLNVPHCIYLKCNHRSRAS